MKLQQIVQIKQAIKRKIVLINKTETLGEKNHIHLNHISVIKSKSFTFSSTETKANAQQKGEKMVSGKADGQMCLGLSCSARDVCTCTCNRKRMTCRFRMLTRRSLVRLVEEGENILIIKTENGFAINSKFKRKIHKHIEREKHSRRFGIPSRGRCFYFFERLRIDGSM